MFIFLMPLISFIIIFFDSLNCLYFSSVKGREIGNEKLIGILDFQQVTYKNVDARGLITGFQFLQVMLCFLKYVQKNNNLCGLYK